MKVLFIHNTIAHYRIPFFCGLNNKLSIDFLFTRENLSKQIYGNDLDYKKIEDINYSFLPSGIKRYKKIKEIVESEEYNKIIIPPIDTFKDYIDCLLIYFFSKRKNKKLFYFGEKWEAPISKQPKKKYFKNRLQALAIKSILKNIDLCIVSGSKSQEYFINLGLNKENIRIAVDASEVEKNDNYLDIRLNKSLNNDTKIILYYGRIIERKGLDKLIKAYKNICYKYKNIALIICGDGKEFKEKCINLAKDLNVKNIFFEGYVDPKNRYDYFYQSDIFVLPSYFYNGISEAWGLTVNESIQCMTPVIATEAVGAAYDLLDGNNGIMISENNIRELEEVLEEFLYKKDVDEIKRACIKTYEKYNYKNMINSFIQYLSE